MADRQPRPNDLTPTEEQREAIKLAMGRESLTIIGRAGAAKTTTLGMIADAMPGRPGQYLAFNKALRADQPVATPDGWKEIGTLRTGDRVFGSDGMPHKVLKVIDRGERPMMTVRFSDGTEVIADQEHLWAIERTTAGIARYTHSEVTTTVAIAEHLSRRCRVRVPRTSALQLPTADLLVDPWLLGVLLGDGSISHNRVCITNLDDWLFSEAERLLPGGCSLRFRSEPNKSARTGAIVGNGKVNALMDRLRAIGVYGLTTADKAVPAEYLWADSVQRLALLQGLMDTDGCTGGARKLPIFTSTSRCLTDAVVFLTQSLGGLASVGVLHRTNPKHTTAYHVTVRLPVDVIPFRRPTQVAKLGAALDLRRESGERQFQKKVRSVESIAPAKAVCISIDSPDHLFLTAGLTPTHNSVATDVGTKMPRSVKASTINSLAYNAVGRPFGHRLSSPRMASSEIANKLGIRSLVVSHGKDRTHLSAGFLASLAIRAVVIYCYSDEIKPSMHHVPYIDGIDPPDDQGRRTYANNNLVRDWISDAMAAIWKDWCDPGGTLPYRHDAYLKLYERTGPYIPADYVLLDEAQDSNDCTVSILNQQDDCQILLVGDSEQQLYAWRHSIDIMDKLQYPRTYLTQTFRFGEAIADVANTLLTRIGAAPETHIRGYAPVNSTVGRIAHPDTILTRTNAKAVEILLETLLENRRPALVGGTNEAVNFAKAAQDLQAGRRTIHPELVCFNSWDEVKDYVVNDAQGMELRLMVSLMDRFTPAAIIKALSSAVEESRADVIISTAHKAKGREWDTVKLAGDFPKLQEGEAELRIDELRLLYVACTRAKLQLDVTEVPQATQRVL